MLYQKLVRPLLFKFSGKDPEKAHNLALALLRYLGWQENILSLVGEFASFESQRLSQNIFGLDFPNPVGLAAGFDKNGVALRGLQSLGFGFLEMGTVTRQAQEGNPRPRIFRFPQDAALINRMGFNNDGSDRVAVRLERNGKIDIPLGISLGKSKITPLEKAADDYLYSLRKLYLYGKYFAVNVSSPNTPGLRQLQEKNYLDALLAAIQEENKVLATEFGVDPKPILVKVAPDLSWAAIDELLEVCFLRKVAGIIVANTTIEREGLNALTKEEGGLSGKPLWKKTITLARYISEQTKGKIPIPIIGVGGISTSEQAYEMLHYASLIQILSGMIYEGPFIASAINRGLLRLMNRDGIKYIWELRR